VERLIDFVDIEMDFAFTGGVIHDGIITFLNAENVRYRCPAPFLLSRTPFWLTPLLPTKPHFHAALPSQVAMFEHEAVRSGGRRPAEAVESKDGGTKRVQ
jgi:hypothetical protein